MLEYPMSFASYKKWDPLSAPVISSVVNYFNVLLETTWPITTAGFFMFFMLDATIVVAIMEHFFEEKKDDPKFPGIMGPIEFLLMSVYGYFLQHQERGYTGPIEKYFAMLQDVSALLPLLRRVKVPYQTKLDILLDQLSAVIAINSPDRNIPVPNALVNYEGSIVSMLDLIEESEHPTLFRTLVQNLYVTRQMERSFAIRSPNIMMEYVYTFLSFWFGIWVPVRLWVALGFFIL